MSENKPSIFTLLILSVILFAAIAIMVSPQFAQAIAVIVLLMVVAGLAKYLSERR